jgi:type II secretory pathway component PulC
MRNIQDLLKNITLLNLILLALAIAGIVCALVPLLNISVNVTPQPAGETIPGTADSASSDMHAPSYTDYAMISDQNLFHPSRKAPAEKKGEMPRPEVILYGTLIADNMRVAYVEDKKSPRTSPGRGKRQIALKQGDTLSGYILKVVEKDRIELAKGDDRIVVYLSDQNKVRSEETTHAASPARAPQAAVQPRAAPAIPRPAVQPRPTPATPQPAVQPRPAPASPQPMVQPKIMPSGPASKTAPSQ